MYKLSNTTNCFNTFVSSQIIIRHNNTYRWLFTNVETVAVAKVDCTHYSHYHLIDLENTVVTFPPI